MNTLTQHLLTFTLYTLLFTSHSYSAFDDEASLALRTAIVQNDVTGVYNALSQRANPNYTPTPHSLTITERLLQKSGYDKIDESRVMFRFYASLPILLLTSPQSLAHQCAIANFCSIVFLSLPVAIIHKHFTQKSAGAPTPDDTKPPLVLAASQPHDPMQIPIIAALLQAKANINGTDADGNTALHYAQKISKQDLASLLIYADANLEIRNKRAERANSRRTHAFRYGQWYLSTMLTQQPTIHIDTPYHEQEQIQQTIHNLATALTDPKNKLQGDKNLARIIATYCLFSDDSTPYAFVETEDNVHIKHTLQHRVETYPAFR